ncbi:uncharacterized protein LOC110821122 [Carica papaya]|uniref:uncharacterized protein LOC110821122 n=1 Tax=Carica papaya TaxID=3649 RepID=UPI000B8CF601|nr:uncharacterized protein LOC110821122 [Carica papaya]
MPPKKKKKSTSSSSSSKKSNVAGNQQSQQPSKFGIHHFFERHTQNALLASQSVGVPALQKPKPPTNPSISASHDAPPTSVSTVNGLNLSKATSSGFSENPNNVVRSVTFDQSKSASIHREPTGTLRTTSQDLEKEANSTTIVGAIAKDELTEVSPEIRKSSSLKRFKFSPGMLIKQSQHDGGDEVTWRISPVNERLQAVTKQTPTVIKELANSSRISSFNIRQCSENKGLCTSPGTACKVEKWLSSPSKKAVERSLVSANKIDLKRPNPCQNGDLCGSVAGTDDSSASQQSPFRTPPSLLYCHNKLANVIASNGASDQLDQRQHRKALLELLDQVEDVISVDDLAANIGINSSKVQVRCGNEVPLKVDSAAERPAMDHPEKVTGTFSSCYFLVLEVSEKHGPAGSSGAQCPYKVIRLLNEQSGEERAVYLWEEWFYSVISPGDTANIIGEFDDEGKCDVNHDNNFLIVHPDILVSGTRVLSPYLF